MHLVCAAWSCACARWGACLMRMRWLWTPGRTGVSPAALRQQGDSNANSKATARQQLLHPCTRAIAGCLPPVWLPGHLHSAGRHLSVAARPSMVVGSGQVLPAIIAPAASCLPPHRWTACKLLLRTLETACFVNGSANEVRCGVISHWEALDSVTQEGCWFISRKGGWGGAVGGVVQAAGFIYPTVPAWLMFGSAAAELRQSCGTLSWVGGSCPCL